MVPSDYLDGFIHYYLFNISCFGTGILKAICVYSKQLENTFRFIKNFFRNFIFFSAKRPDVVFKLSVLEIKKKKSKQNFIWHWTYMNDLYPLVVRHMTMTFCLTFYCNMTKVSCRQTQIKSRASNRSQPTSIDFWFWGNTFIQPEPISINPFEVLLISYCHMSY